MTSGKRPIERLKGLADKPAEQAQYACQLLQNPRTSKPLRIAALETLGRHPLDEAHDYLVEQFSFYADQGEVRDPGSQIRTLLIKALRPIAQGSDQDLFERAVTTYEFLPPAFREEAIPLRAAGLLALNELEDRLTLFHATRLLADPYTDPMSGEPAVTAVRVLGSRQELLPLYYYVMQPAENSLPELVSESLQHLTTLPTSLLPGILQRYQETNSEVIALGLFDLLLNHESGPQEEDFLIDFLKSGRMLNAYRYLVSVIVADHKQTLLYHLLQVARFEHDAHKAGILVESLEPVSRDPSAAAVMGTLKKRLEP